MPRSIVLACLALTLACVPAAGSAVGTPATRCSVDFQARNANLDCAVEIPGGRLRFAGTPVLMTEVRGSETATFAYDGLGRPVRAEVDGRATSYAYGLDGRLSALVGPGGESVSYAYDSLGRLVGAGGTRFEYSTGGLARAVGDGLDAAFAYDPRGNLVTARDGERETRFDYDAHRLVTLVDGPGETTAYEYDAGDPVRRVRNGEPTSYGYDRRGELVRAAGAQNAQLAYDADGSLLEAVSSGAATSFGYGRGGRLTRITDSVGGNTELGYDELGQLVLVRSAVGDEVVVSFEEGEPDQPLVVGAVWSDGAGRSFSISLRGRIETCSDCP